MESTTPITPSWLGRVTMRVGKTAPDQEICPRLICLAYPWPTVPARGRRKATEASRAGTAAERPEAGIGPGKGLQGAYK